jgi:hypothetical protein
MQALSLAFYFGINSFSSSNGEDVDPGSQLDKKYTKYHQDLDGVGGNTRGAY